MSDRPNLRAEYDDIADVLYLTVASGRVKDALEDESGLVWRHASDGRLLGVTIVDFRYQWENASKQRDLVNRIAARLHLSSKQTRKVLEDA